LEIDPMNILHHIPSLALKISQKMVVLIF